MKNQTIKLESLSEQFLLDQRKLPLLDACCEMFRHLDFENVLVIAVQHLYETTYSMFRRFFEMGLKPENLFVLGKCYSTDPKVFWRLVEDGVKVSSSSMRFNPNVPYDIDFEKSVNNLLSEVKTSVDFCKFEKIIILDDGGHLLEQVDFLHQHHNVAGVEQTSSGFNRLKSQQVQFPIVNLARAWLKLKYESPIIIKLAQKKILERLNNLNVTPKRILVIGHGTLGQHVKVVLEKEYEVHAYDRSTERSTFDHDSFCKTVGSFDVIIGCTGETSFPAAYLQYLTRPTTLISLSSSDREFEGSTLRKLSSAVKGCHCDVQFNNITLLNCGFPINFDADHDVIDTDDFQLTRALICAAVCQAFSTDTTGKNNGFQDMDNTIQLNLLDHWQRINAIPLEEELCLHLSTL